ncbi:tyrosine-type recombinase/integrase [Asaia siamensis]|nr:tyrosine-type recombinase/integrase [Asaia siamensis]
MFDLQKQDYAAGMVAEFEPVHIRRIMARHADTPAAANNRLKILRLAFDHAVDDGWRQDNPAKTVKKYREKAEGATPWKEEQITQFLDHWPVGTAPRLALLLLLYSGQRRSDVVRMGRQHVRGDLLEVTQQKTGASLMIPLHSVLAYELEHAPQEGTFLQTGKGEAFTANGFYMRFKSWRAAAGLPDGLSPHGLRKAAARRLAEAGCSAHQIAAITGHATLSEVERYTRAADQEMLARAAMAKIR